MKAEYDFSKARRGAVVPAAPGKTRITIRLDSEVIEWFKPQVNDAAGGNYQSLINEALKGRIQHHDLERTPLLFASSLWRHSCMTAHATVAQYA